MNNVKKPQWSDPHLEQGYFLYQRTGPWPQPSPSYPMEHAPEVLNIPAVEQLIWNDIIGARLLTTQVGFPPMAAAYAAVDATQEIPSDDEFVRVMTSSMYARYLRNTAGDAWTASFSAMKLIADATLPGTYCAPVVCHFKRAGTQFSCEKIEFPRISLPPLDVKPGDPAWNLSKAYALQGATYHALFVVHPALHFPMDSVNAITKSAVPHIHPLFQLLYPHTAYTLALDNAVLEGPNSVVNNNVAGTWYDPLTAKGVDILRLFGPGYIGVEKNPVAYPAYDYLNPWMDERLPYGKCLKLYFDAFLTFATFVADEILANSPDDPYVKRWAKYIQANIPSFPDEKQIFEPGVLARTMAIYMWDVSVAHGADHYSFITDVAPQPNTVKAPTAPEGPLVSIGNEPLRLACWKFLRIRVAPPTETPAPPPVATVGDLCDAEDLHRTEMAQNMFFGAWTNKPNLSETYYAFASTGLLGAQLLFHEQLKSVNEQVKNIMPSFMPLLATSDQDYSITLPASIQY